MFWDDWWPVLAGIAIVGILVFFMVKAAQKEDAQIQARCDHTMSLASTAFERAQAEMSCEALKQAVQSRRSADAAAAWAASNAGRR